MSDARWRPSAAVAMLADGSNLIRSDLPDWQPATGSVDKDLA
jgi:hypothetical protein